MAESTLTLAYSDLMKEVNDFLGHGRVATDTNGVVDPIVQSGYRRLLYPELNPGVSSYQWRFLRPTASIIVWPDIAVSAATVTVTGTNTATASTAKFHPSMVGKVIDLTGAADFTISGYTSTTVVTGSGTNAGPVTFTIAADGSYRLPDDFGGIEGDLTFAPTQIWKTIALGSESQWREMMQLNDTSGVPVMAAVRPLSADGSAGQRFDLLIYPEPQEQYTLYYRKKVLVNKLVSSTNEYPLGGMLISELLLEACLMVAEQRKNDEVGLHTNNFLSMLPSVIQRDREAYAPDFLGFSRDTREEIGVVYDPRQVRSVTYEGAQY